MTGEEQDLQRRRALEAANVVRSGRSALKTAIAHDASWATLCAILRRQGDDLGVVTSTGVEARQAHVDGLLVGDLVMRAPGIAVIRASRLLNEVGITSSTKLSHLSRERRERVARAVELYRTTRRGDVLEDIAAGRRRRAKLKAAAAATTNTTTEDAR